MLTAFFASEVIETTARRTGWVKRTSKITGKIFLVLVTFGGWSEAKTTLAPWAAPVTAWVDQLEVSPEALEQRMHKKAPACLQERIRHALATVPSIDTVCADGLLTSFPKVS